MTRDKGVCANSLKNRVAQLVEQRTENPRVGGSSPPPGTTFQVQRSMDRGPQTGVTGAVSKSALDFIEGVGLRMAGLAF